MAASSSTSAFSHELLSLTLAPYSSEEEKRRQRDLERTCTQTDNIDNRSTMTILTETPNSSIPHQSFKEHNEGNLSKSPTPHSPSFYPSSEPCPSLASDCLQTEPTSGNYSIRHVDSALQLTAANNTTSYSELQQQSHDSDEEHVVSSLESLSLTDSRPHVAAPLYCPRTCRQEALWEDITVDDLAGYMDQLLYLPRPMSDMAELMYA